MRTATFSYELLFEFFADNKGTRSDVSCSDRVLVPSIAFRLLQEYQSGQAVNSAKSPLADTHPN